MSSEVLTLLLVEDSPEDRHVFRAYLEQAAGYTFHFLEEEDADAALAVCQRQRVDCILLDYELPGLNGLEFLKRLEDEKGLMRSPVVMVTGRGSEGVAVRALKGGVSDYLMKSEVTPESLLRAVRNAVEKDTILQRLAAQQSRAGRAEARLRLALEVVEHGEALCVLDKDFRIVLVNKNQERLSGSRREHTLDRDLWEMFPPVADPSRKYWSEYQRAVREQVPVQFEEYYPPLDLWTDVCAYPTQEGGLAIFFRDISERKRAEHALRESEERRRAEERQRAEFEQQLIGIVSHDLRNPINAITLGASGLLRRRDLDAHTLQVLARLQNSADRASRMVRDLLDFTQARLGGGIPLHRRAMDLNALLPPVLDEVRTAFPQRELHMDISGDGEGAWDSDRVAQVITNLTTNALKYSPVGTPVTVSTQPLADSVLLAVHNHGAPIPPHVREYLFQPLRRGVDDADRAHRSIGLGLFIVNSIVHAHGGAIDVRSTEGDGTTFTVRLPR